MTVQDIICQTLRLVGRDDVADAVADGGELASEENRLLNVFHTYFNSVVDELARGYFPPSARDLVTRTDGKILLSALSHRAVGIRKIIVDKKSVGWRIYGDELVVDGDTCVVYYEYSPAPFGLNDEFFYPDFAVSERLIRYGMAAEYFLVCGCADETHLWEEKYRDEIETLRARCVIKPRVPPRRWI